MSYALKKGGGQERKLKKEFVFNVTSRKLKMNFILLQTVLITMRQDYCLMKFNTSKGKWDLKHRSKWDQFMILINGSGDEVEQEIFKLFQKYLMKCFKLKDANASK